MKKLLLRPLRWFWHLSLKRKLLTLVILGIVFFLLRPILFPSAPAQSYSFAEVTRGDISEVISETGNIESSNLVSIISPTRGVVTELYVQNNQVVSSGQQLAKVISTADASEKATARANYLSAQSSLTTARQTKTTNQSQLEQARKAILDAQEGVTTMENRVAASQPNPSTGRQYTQNEIDAIRSTLTSARQSFTAAETKYSQSDVSIASAQASLTASKLAYEETLDAVLTAPVAGTVINLAIQNGDVVSTTSSAAATTVASVTTTGISTVMMIQTSSESYAKVQINETDIRSVAYGQEAEVSLDAIPDEVYTGTVDRIDFAGQNDSGVISYSVYVKITNADDQIRPAMTASVDITTQRKSNVLLVPNSAVKPYQGGKAVQVVDTQERPTPNGLPPVKFVPVTIGVVGIGETEIVSGVEEGTQVITGTQANTRQGGGLLPNPQGPQRNGGQEN